MSNPFDQFDGANASASNPFDQFDAPPANKKQNKGIAGDLVTDFKRGIEQVPGAFTGLADIPVAAITGKPLIGQAADALGGITGFVPSKWAKDAEAEYSPGRVEARRNIDQAWEDNKTPFADAASGDFRGIGQIAKSYIQNPQQLVGSVVESLPTMYGGAKAGQAIAKGLGIVAPKIAAGIGEGSVMAGQQMNQLSQTEADPRTAAAASAITGITGGAIGVLGGKIASKLGVIDPDVALAGGALRGVTDEVKDQSVKGMIKEGAKRVAGGAVSEGAFEELPQSVLEQVLSNLAQSKPWDEGVSRAAVEGTLAGALMGGAFNVMPPKQEKKADTPPATDTPAENPTLALPAPTYTGTPGDQIIAADADRQAAIDKAQAESDAIWAARDEYERQQAEYRKRPMPTITNDPEPIQKRIDALMGINESRLQGFARTNYEKALENAFAEQIGFVSGKDSLEVPFTMGDYLKSKVAAADIDRKQAPKQTAPAGITAAPVIPVVGTLSAAANLAVQSGAHAAHVAQQQAAIQNSQAEASSTKPGKADTPTTGNREAAPQAGILAGIAAQAPSVAQPAPNTQPQGQGGMPATAQQSVPAAASPAGEVFDVSKRTNQQLEYLSQHGQPGWKEAAAVEIQKRGAQISVPQRAKSDTLGSGEKAKPEQQAENSESTVALKDKNSANLPEKEKKSLSIGTMPNTAEPVTVKDGVVHIGKYPAQNFDTGEDVTVPEGATDQQIVTALKDAGAIAPKHKVFGAEKEAQPAPEDTIGWTRMTKVEREALVARAGWAGKIRGMNLGGVRVASQAWDAMTEANRAKLIEADQNPIKNEKPDAATAPAESATQDQEPIKNQSGESTDMVPPKLEVIAERLGVEIIKAKSGFHASSNGKYVAVPAEDEDAKGAVSAAHILAHELGHAALQKRGLNFSGIPQNVMAKQYAPNWLELVGASKAFRPGVWNHENDRIRKHAKKANEVVADAIASVMMGLKPVSMLDGLLKNTGTTLHDLGLQSIDEANAEYAKRAGKGDDAVSQPKTDTAPEVKQDQAPAITVPQHVENGKTEPATAAVVDQSLKKGADNSPLDLRQERDLLLQKVDQAIAAAPTAEEKDAWDRVNQKIDLTNNMHVADTIGYRIFDVPGDGKFKVLNLKEALQRFRERIESNPGFRKPINEKPKMMADWQKTGRGGTEATIKELLDDGELLAAVEYAKQIGKPLVFGQYKDGSSVTVYTESKPFEQEGYDDFKMVSARAAGAADKVAWAIIDLGSGMTVSSKHPTRMKAIAETRQALAKMDAAQLATAVRSAKANSGFVGTQEELEQRWVEWAAKQEELHQAKNEQEHRQKMRGAKRGLLADYTGKPVEEAGKPIAPPANSQKTDYKGFKRVDAGYGKFELHDGNMVVKVESTGNGKYQASFKSAKSSPHLVGEQGAIDWAASYRNDAVKNESDSLAEDIAAGVKNANDPARQAAVMDDIEAKASAATGAKQTSTVSAEKEAKPESAKTADASEETGTKNSSAPIGDFGEKIGGAKKDLWTGYKEKLASAESLDIKAEPLSKSWPAPDYEALIEAGVDSFVVAFVRASRDSIPRKPTATWKLKSWAGGVELLRDTSKKLIAGELSATQAKELLQKAGDISRGMREIAGRIELYQLVGHRQSLDGISLSNHFYSLYKGKENVNLWAVEKEAKATAFSNMPAEIVTGATKQEVLDKFKALYDKVDFNKKADRAVTFDLYSQAGKFYVGKKMGRNITQLAGPFDTVKETRAYRDENYDELVKRLEKAKEIPKLRRDKNEPRVGEDMRDGQDVTPEMFAESFGFKGVEFGNWVEQKKRQKDLNESFDALMDMAAILGVPPKALSLNGQLGLAFGARGSGGIDPAAAHYERDFVVINLTKKEGAGSLGHEWWHALDNYFSRSRGKGSDMMTEALDVSLAGRGSDFIANTSVRKEMIQAFGRVVNAIKMTALRERSMKLDRKRSNAYWTTTPEMSARAFESYLISKLQDQNASNDYLANIVDDQTWKAAESLGFELDDSYPYPTAGEMPLIREAFDKFFQTVETKETERGTALYNIAGKDSLSPADTAIYGMASEGKSAAEIMKFIASASRNPLNRQLAKLLLKTGIAPRMTVGTSDGWKFNAGNDKKYAAAYNPKANTVALFRPASAERHVLHELMHAATLKALNKKGLAAIQMKALFAHVKKSGELKGMYGMSDVDEFVAEAFTNPKFQEALKKVAAPKGGNKLSSAWHWFVRIVRGILGIPQGQENALSQAIEIGLGVMRENMRLSGEATDTAIRGMESKSLPDTITIDGVERPTRNSNGQPIHPTGGGIRNFWRWFGDSKVVDAQGRPLVVYHGTASDITAFDMNRPGESTGNTGFYGAGAYFSEDADYASGFSFWAKLSEDHAPNVVPVYLSLKNPAYINIAPKQQASIEKSKATAAKLISTLIDRGTGQAVVEKLRGFVSENKFEPFMGTIYNALGGGEGTTALLKEAGFDGVTIYGGISGKEKLAEAVAFHPEQIKSAIGNRGTFDPNNPDIRYNVADESWTVAEPSKMDDVIYSLQDKHIDTKRVMQAIFRTGKKIRDAFNPYLQEELFHGRSAKKVKDFLDDELRPLLKAMQDHDVDMGDFEEYLWNRHAEERNKQIAKINPDMPDGGSGIETADARAYLAALSPERRRIYAMLAGKVEAMNRNSQEILVSSGLETQETIDAWNNAYSHYVPLQREDVDSGHIGTGKGFSVRGASTKRAMGSGRKVVDIIGNLAMQRERNIVRAEKNRVSNALLGLAVQNPNPDFWKVDQAPKERVVNNVAIYNVLDANGKKVADFTKMDEADRMARNIGGEVEQTWGDRVQERIEPGFLSRDNVLLTRVNGQDHYIIFNERDERAMRMAMAMKNLDVDGLGRVLSVVGKATRYLASINTQYNPVFGVINLIRDAQGALINLSSTALAGEQKRVLGYTKDALVGIYKDIRAHRVGGKPSSNWAALFEEFQKEGGQTGYRDQYANAEARAEAIKAELEQFKDGKAKQFTRGLFGWLSDYNETMENAVRLAAYKAAKEKGMSNQQAASLAKNITVNFNRKGQMATQVGALYAFFNASVQGTARIAETLFEQHGGDIKAVRLSKKGKQIMLGGIMLGSMQAMLLAAAGYDDDEPPEFVRERNLILPIGDGKYLTLAMPLGLHVIPGIGRIATEFVLSGGKDPLKRIASFGSMFIDAFNPVGNSGSLLQMITPTVVDPFAVLAENKDFTGREIYRDDFNKLNPTPGHTRAKDTASIWSRAISEGLNFITGGSDYRPGLVSPSPDSIDYLIGQATGGVGREFSKLSQTIGAASTGEDLPLYKVPLVGRFVGDTAGQGGQSQKFYEAIRQINMHEAQYKGLIKDGRSAEAREYLAENPAVKLIMAGNHAELAVRKLRTMKRDLVENEADPAKVRAIDDRITATMRAFNERAANAI